MIYLAVLAMTLIGAMGAFFLKAGMDRVDSLPALFRTPQIYLGGGFYLAGAGLNIRRLFGGVPHQTEAYWRGCGCAGCGNSVPIREKCKQIMNPIAF